MKILEPNRSIQDVQLMPPLVWAYVGDCVYELAIRTHLTNITKLKPHELHVKAIQYVKAQAQAQILEKLQEMLTETEKEIVRRGRNAQNHHIPKNADPADYMYATAFEALIGYLYLSQQEDRLTQIIDQCIKIIE